MSLRQLLWRLRERRIKRQCGVPLVVMVLLVTCLYIFKYDTVEVNTAAIPDNFIRRTSLPTLPLPVQSSRPILAKNRGFEWCERPSVDKPNLVEEPQTWQNVDGRNVSVFSAYIDERANVGGPMVRIIASGLQTAFNEVGELYCQLWYDNLDDPVTFGPATYDLIYPSTLHGDMWVAHFILCDLPSNDTLLPQLGIPYTVSVVGERCTSYVENQLVILNKKEQFTQPSFALCLPVLYGRSVDAQMLSEWIELHSIMGIGEIFLYNFSIADDVTRLLSTYQQHNNVATRVNVVRWRFPSQHLVSYFCQHEAINDCVYRAASQGHNYVIVNDLDEILVPRKQGHMTMMNFVDDATKRSRDVGAYIFQHAYFRRNKTSSEEPYLVSMQSLWRTNEVTPPGKIRSKTMYDVKRLIKANIHSAYKLVDTATELIVDPQDGMLHHYRQSPMETFRKHPEKFTFIEDTFMLKYRDKLIQQVNGRQTILK